jgi:Adenylosuccinate synthase
VLDGIEELQLCVGYELDGEKIDILPLGATTLSAASPSTNPFPAGPTPPWV